MNDSKSAATAEVLAAQNARLREELDALKADNQRLSAQLVAAEEQGAGLVKLYVSNRRLNEASDRRDALEAIQEIIISVIGCEEFAILEAGAGGAALSVSASYGLDATRLGADAATVIASVVASGEPWFAPERPLSVDEEQEMTACVPMRVGRRVTGAIALYSLLPHKPALEQIDRTLLDLLGTEAARTLLATSSLRSSHPASASA